MAMTADAANHQSNHRGSSGAGDPINSPSKRTNLHSPWAQVVRSNPESANPTSPAGVSPSPVETPAPEQSPPVENPPTEGSEATKQKKPAWNKPAAVSSSAEGSRSPVMGAVSWPALSESTKASPKSLSLIAAEEPSPKALTDGSSPNSQGPLIPHSPHKQGSGQSKSGSLQNNTFLARQRSMKRGVGGGGSGGNGKGNSSSLVGGHSQNSFTNPPQAPPPLPFPMLSLPSNGFSNHAPTMLEPSPRSPNWDPIPVGAFVPQPSMVNDQRHSSRRGSFGSRPDGPHQNNYGRRRDQERGHHGNIRDANAQRGSPRGFPRHPPPNTAAFVPPQSLRPPYNPMGYNEVPYIPPMAVDPFRAVPFIGLPPALPFHMPIPDPLSDRIVKQIEYYFSDDNLVKDDFLRSKMDEQGWVPITLIAGFNRVKSMTNNIPLILDSLRTSTVLEVLDDRVRRRNDWIKWIHNTGRISADAGMQSPGAPGYDTLTKSFQSISMENATADLNSTTAESLSLSKDVPSRRLSEQVSQEEGFEGASSS